MYCLTYRLISQFPSTRPDCSGSSRSGWPTRVDNRARGFISTPGFFSLSCGCYRKREFRASPFLNKDSASFRTPSFSLAPRSLRTSPGSQGAYHTLSHRRRGFLTLGSQHIPPDSLDIHAILCCKHGFVFKSFTHEHVIEFH